MSHGAWRSENGTNKIYEQNRLAFHAIEHLPLLSGRRMDQKVQPLERLQKRPGRFHRILAEQMGQRESHEDLPGSRATIPGLAPS